MKRIAPVFLAFALAGAAAQDDTARKMQTIDRALGVECAYCHAADDWKKDEKPSFGFSQRMMRMTEGLSTGPLRSLGGVTCWSCHRGNSKPARMPRAAWEDRLAHWPEELKLSAGDAKKPAGEVYRNLQSLAKSPAGGLAMVMSTFSGALDVSCDYCHVPGRWDADDKPAKRTARLMIALFSEIPKYYDSSRQLSMQCYTCHQGAARPER